MLELKDVWKGFRKGQKQRWILAGSNLVLPPGRRIGLLGAKGAGKTSVIRLLSGVESPDKGAIRRIGLACWPFSHASFVESTATLRQNARFLGHIYGLDADEIAEIAAELSGVRIARAKPLREYKAFERRQIALGLTLSLQFDWYFVDDTLPSTNPAALDAVDAAIADRLSRAGVVWATSNPDLIAGYCDAGMVLDRGVMTFYNTFEEASDAFRRLTAARGAKRL
jgi:capsular polysaccharide transport system ATP-binding protein